MTYGFPAGLIATWHAVSIVLCVLAAGCAVPYKEVLQNGYKYTSESIRKPSEVAECVTARMASQREWRLTRRALDDRGSIELVVGSGDQSVAGIAHVYPSPYGSRVDSWISQRAVVTRDIWQYEFFGAC
jgi:hypothetical protein